MPECNKSKFRFHRILNFGKIPDQSRIVPNMDFRENQFTLVYIKITFRFAVTKIFGIYKNHVIWCCEILKSGMIWGTRRKTKFGFSQAFYFSVCTITKITKISITVIS